MDNLDLIQSDDIERRIIIIRNRQVMIDRDLADIYGVKTKRLMEQVKRNIERFPYDFCFQLDDDEFAIWRSHFATSKSDQKGLRRPPYAFTEQGVAMLASVLKTKTAHIGEKLDLALAKHNSQYQPITIERFNKSHDRFLIIDDDVYLIGGSIKDLGKKVSTFVKLSIPKGEFLGKLLSL